MHQYVSYHKHRRDTTRISNLKKPFVILMLMSHHLYKHLSKKHQKTIIDKSMSIAAVIHPLSAVPQVYSIYSTQDVSGISLLTWLGFMLLGLIFLSYGILHKIRPLIVTQVLWFIVDFLVVIGVIIYR